MDDIPKIPEQSVFKKQQKRDPKLVDLRMWLKGRALSDDVKRKCEGQSKLFYLEVSSARG